MNRAASAPPATRIGVLLVNLGTPASTKPADVGRYLGEFLSDPRVVELPALLWKPLLYGVILPFRSRASAAKYETVWLDEGSPLKVYTERQAAGLQTVLDERLPEPVVVRYAMRYAGPAIVDTLAEMHAAGCERILVLPLYPQYAASTTATALDQVYRYCARTRNMPEIRALKDFHTHPAYIATLARMVQDEWQGHGRPDRLVMSFHGLPRAQVDRGDPYQAQCRETGRLLAHALGLGEEEWIVSFQSRFGRAEWLQPYTAETVEALGRQGIQRVHVICPGFVSDCLETLEEIGMEVKQGFLDAGGSAFHVIPCLNDHPAWIDTLAQIVVEQLGGWIAGVGGGGTPPARALHSPTD